MSSAKTAAAKTQPQPSRGTAAEMMERRQRELLEQQLNALPPCDEGWSEIHRDIGSIVTKMRDRAKSELEAELRAAFEAIDQEDPSFAAAAEAEKGRGGAPENGEKQQEQEEETKLRLLREKRQRWGWARMREAADNGCVGFLWFHTRHGPIWSTKHEWIESAVRSVVPDATYQIVPSMDGHSGKSAIAILMAVPRDPTQRMLMMSSVESGFGLWIWDAENQRAVSVPPLPVA